MASTDAMTARCSSPTNFVGKVVGTERARLAGIASTTLTSAAARVRFLLAMAKVARSASSVGPALGPVRDTQSARVPPDQTATAPPPAMRTGRGQGRPQPPRSIPESAPAGLVRCLVTSARAFAASFSGLPLEVGAKPAACRLGCIRSVVAMPAPLAMVWLNFCPAGGILGKVHELTLSAACR